ncbi:MAG: zinc finger domain-containing protein [Bdellovibrionota bacterium]
MSSEWDADSASAKLNAKPKHQVCDLLMDQTIFSGLGNIMKNEILFILKMHPETKIESLSQKRIREVVRESEAYAWQFYEWKKENILKRNWKVMRKKKCPDCGGKISKRETGKLKRVSHYCPRCQSKN